MPENSIQPILTWIATQRPQMVARLIHWSNINSYTLNTAGLAQVTEAVIQEFSPLGGTLHKHNLRPAEVIGPRAEIIHHPLGQAITIDKRPTAPVRILLNIHLDTVYPPTSPFQSVKEDANTLHGPGVADAKGGLAVMLTALEALERSPDAARIGWHVLLNPDEEIGSPSSLPFLAQAAKDCHFGLLFEPALSDGALVNRRRGSGNFTIIVRGRAAHAGRDFSAGRSALLAAAKISLELHALNESLPGITINIGAIDGGGPTNVVPDLAICRFNIRTTEPADEQTALQAIHKLLADLNTAEGITAELQGEFISSPKILDDRTSHLLSAITSCGHDLGVNLTARASGGVSDGNRFAAAGLPNIDTLGVRGDRIHSPDEFMHIDSLVERAQLTALLMLKIAAGHIDPTPFCR